MSTTRNGDKLGGSMGDETTALCVFKHRRPPHRSSTSEKEGATKIGKVINKPQNESVPPYGNLCVAAVVG